MRTAPRKARTGTAALGSHRPEPREPAQWEPQPPASSPKPRTARESQPQESGRHNRRAPGARRTWGCVQGRQALFGGHRCGCGRHAGRTIRLVRLCAQTPWVSRARTATERLTDAGSRDGDRQTLSPFSAPHLERSARKELWARVLCLFEVLSGNSRKRALACVCV